MPCHVRTISSRCYDSTGKLLSQLQGTFLHIFFQVIIEGVVRGGSSGDIAIDDVNLIDGYCPKVETQGKKGFS